jgi:hypothetical protein
MKPMFYLLGLERGGGKRQPQMPGLRWQGRRISDLSVFATKQ